MPFTVYPAVYSSARVHKGDWAMRIGIVTPNDNVESYSSARQWVTIPDNVESAVLDFWLYPISGDPSLLKFPEKPLHPELEKMPLSADAQYVLILNEQGEWIDTLLWMANNSQQWTNYQFDLTDYAGKTIKLHFGTFNNGTDGVTGMYADDASLKMCVSPR
jgi:hypothetical protein